MNFERATVCVSRNILTVYTDDEKIETDFSCEDDLLLEMKGFLSLLKDGEETDKNDAETIKESVRLVMAEIKSSKIRDFVEL